MILKPDDIFGTPNAREGFAFIDAFLRESFQCGLRDIVCRGDEVGEFRYFNRQPELALDERVAHFFDGLLSAAGVHFLIKIGIAVRV